jgi:hypothetical protein
MRQDMALLAAATLVFAWAYVSRRARWSVSIPVISAFASTVVITRSWFVELSYSYLAEEGWPRVWVAGLWDDLTIVMFLGAMLVPWVFIGVGPVRLLWAPVIVVVLPLLVSAIPTSLDPRFHYFATLPLYSSVAAARPRSSSRTASPIRIRVAGIALGLVIGPVGLGTLAPGLLTAPGIVSRWLEGRPDIEAALRLHRCLEGVPRMVPDGLVAWSNPGDPVTLIPVPMLDLAPHEGFPPLVRAGPSGFEGMLLNPTDHWGVPTSRLRDPSGFGFERVLDVDIANLELWQTNGAPRLPRCAQSTP